MKKYNHNSAIESFLVMLLMVVFTAATSLIIIQGKLAFERVTENKSQDENSRIALSYINKRIRQSDQKNGIQLIDNSVEGKEALVIKNDLGFETYIFFYDGMLYECYTDEAPTIELSMPLVALDYLDFTLEPNGITMEIIYELHGEDILLDQYIAFRSKGVIDVQE
ncbi:MAG: DUF4860 domain-containing protein [Clostridia bacterium]|nr:DUF4860 domain-containing protein [Clostridia bacterium]